MKLAIDGLKGELYNLHLPPKHTSDVAIASLLFRVRLMYEQV